MSQFARRPIIRIRPQRGLPTIDFIEVYQYRYLLFLFVRRDISVKYRQAILGIAWALIVPLSTMAIFGTVFGKAARIPTDGLDPYLFYLSALVPWQYFAGSLSVSSMSLLGNGALLNRVYFPRLLIPLGSCLAGLLDFGIAFLMLIALGIFLDVGIAIEVVLVPLYMVLAFSAAFSAGLILAPLNLLYRDIKFVLPFLIQLWMFATVVLPPSAIPDEWRFLYGLNPMAGVVAGMRWSMFHPVMSPELSEPPWSLLLSGIAVTIGLLVLGLFTFRRTEKLFSDLV